MQRAREARELRAERPIKSPRSRRSKRQTGPDGGEPEAHRDTAGVSARTFAWNIRRVIAATRPASMRRMGVYWQLVVAGVTSLVAPFAPRPSIHAQRARSGRSGTKMSNAARARSSARARASILTRAALRRGVR